MSEIIEEIEANLFQQYTESDIRRIVAGNPLFTLDNLVSQLKIRANSDHKDLLKKVYGVHLYKNYKYLIFNKGGKYHR